MSIDPARQSAVIIPFPRLSARRLSAQDCAEANDWVATARVAGYAQARICKGDTDGDFVVAYWKGELWTAQPVSGAGRRFALSCKGDPQTHEFTTLRAALDAILSPSLRRTRVRGQTKTRPIAI